MRDPTVERLNVIFSPAAKWNFANFQSPTYSAIMMEYTTPPAYGSTVVNVGGIATDGEIICAGSDNFSQHTEVKNDPDNEWPEPSAAKFVWSGKTKGGNPVKAELSGNLGKRLDKIDVMAKVPGFIKTIVGGVAGTRPYIYQVSHDQKDGTERSLLILCPSIPHSSDLR